MPRAAAFDLEKFASMLKLEVEDIANRRYGGNSASALGRAFTFWCIKNVSSKLSETEIELARSICEPGGPGDESIDGAWIDGDTLYFTQTKYSDPKLPNQEDEDFRPPSFSSDAAKQLEQGFLRLRNYFQKKLGPGAPSRKLLEVARLYEDALAKKLRINLVVAISGKARTALIDKVEEMNRSFNDDRKLYPKHFVYIYDLDALNQTISDNLASPPGTVYLGVDQDFTISNPDGSTYAIACVVDASEFVRVREECGYNIYHSNFRFLLTRGGVARPKIEKTLADPAERRNFWRYNNGITIACETVTVSSPKKLEIKGLQVVNGLQTIEALYDNKDRNGWIKDVKVLVRIIPTKTSTSSDPSEARQLEERIAEYSNSQTPIRPRDLRSNDAIQIEIERILSEVYGLKYVRKVGDIPGLRGRPSRQRVDNEEAAQASLAFWHGLSYEAKHQRRLIFERTGSAPSGYYDTIFNEKTTAQYVLLPYILYEEEYKFIYDISDKTARGTDSSLDMLGLAVVGNAFKSCLNIPSEPVTSEKVTSILRSTIDTIRKNTNETRRLWKLVFKALGVLAERRRRLQARKEDRDVEDISMLNVVARMRYTDKNLRKELRRRPEISQVNKIVRNLGR